MPATSIARFHWPWSYFPKLLKLHCIGFHNWNVCLCLIHLHNFKLGFLWKKYAPIHLYIRYAIILGFDSRYITKQISVWVISIQPFSWKMCVYFIKGWLHLRTFKNCGKINFLNGHTSLNCTNSQCLSCNLLQSN